MADNNDSNNVGYGKPPKHGQFVKGKSGNPKGRPKGSKNLATILEKIGQERITVTEQGRQRTITKKEAIMLQLTNKGVSGDIKAIREHIHLTRICESSEQSTQAQVLDERDRAVLANTLKRIRQTDPEDGVDPAPKDSSAQEEK
jgi:Family of unknown function (DUF5681)